MKNHSLNSVLDWREIRDPASDEACRADDLAEVDAPTMDTPVNGGADNRPSSSEMRSGPGFRINTNFDCVSALQINQLLEFETPEISDALNRMFTVDPRIRNVVNDQRLYGPAITVKVFSRGQLDGAQGAGYCKTR